MLELPEVLTVAKQLDEKLNGKKVLQVLPPTKAHKFCWFSAEPVAFDKALRGSRAEVTKGFGIFVEITFDTGYHLCFNDGINCRLAPYAEVPKDYQLLIEFEDDLKLVFTVGMYGGLVLHNDGVVNEYYGKSLAYISPFQPEFAAYYQKLLAKSKPNLSAKAFLATEQRFPGIGNGTLQDILYAAGIHPKRKIGTMTDAEKENLQLCIVRVLDEMTKAGGQIVKEAYLGGSVYYCPICQPLA